MKSLKFNFLGVIALTGLLTACTAKKHHPLFDTISRLDKSFNYDDNHNAYVIIPNSGCPGCITNAESFVLTGLKQNYPVKFVFTRISSLKIFRNKLGDSVYNNQNVILDTLNTITYPEQEKEIYPMIVYPEKNNKIMIDYQSPESEGIKHLVDRITKNAF